MKTYHDIVGDGGSDVLGQVAEQRSRIAANLAGVRHLVAVGSGKGGVGKSTLTMQLAGAMRARGARVAILDADLNGPSQARLAGLRQTTPVPGARGLAVPRTSSGVGVVSLGSFVPESEAVDFRTVADGESYVWRATKEFALFGELLASADFGELDVLFVDLPPGAERTFQYAEYLGDETAFVLVTLPSDLARCVVARSVAALEKAGARILGYIENMSGYYCAECGATRPLFPGSGTVGLGVPLLGRVPFDPELAAASDRGEAHPEEGGSPAARAIADVATRVRESMEATT